MVRMNVSATQEQQQPHTNKNNSNISSNSNTNQNNHNESSIHNNAASTSSSTSSLNSNTSSTQERSNTTAGIVMVVPQPMAAAQQQQQQGAPPPMPQYMHAHHVAAAQQQHHQLHHHHLQQQQPQQQSHEANGVPSLPASPPLLQSANAPTQAAQLVPAQVCAVHHPQGLVAAMQQHAAHIAAGGTLGPPPHLHHAAHHVPTAAQMQPQQLVGNSAQQQAPSSQHSQAPIENGHHVVPGPGVSPSGSTGSSSGSIGGGGGGNNSATVVTSTAPPPPTGPLYIQYGPEFYPEYFLAPHPHDGMCPQHPHHHQAVCAIPSEYGPTTVQMVSQNRPPPMPVPVQVPPGQVMQQYVNESGTLTHVVLSPQQYQQLHTAQGHLHAPFLTPNGTSHYYSPLPAGYAAGPGGAPTHYHAMPGGHMQPQPPPPPQQAPSPQQPPQQPMTHSPHSPSPPNSYHKDERSQRQHNKLLRKLEKQREYNSAMSTPAHSPSPRRNDINGHHANNNNNSQNASANNSNTATMAANHSQYHQHQGPLLNNHHNHSRRMPQRNGVANTAATHAQSNAATLGGGASSVGTSEDGEDTSSVAPEDEEDYKTSIEEQLSAIQKPEVIDITSRSAKFIWEAPTITDPMLINVSHLRYNVLLSDRAKERKFKSLYKGESNDCIVQDLQPGQEYVVLLQVHYEKLQGAASEPTEFTTPPCEPDPPMPPKLVMRTKNSLHLRWVSPQHNGSPILHYLLEYDEGKVGAPATSRAARQLGVQLNFVEAAKTKGKHYVLNKLQPSTVYNFRLAAINEVGASMYSPICTYTTGGNPPAAPKAPSLQGFSANSLRLAWERKQQDCDYVLQMLDRDTGHGFLNVYNGPDTYYECIQLRRATAYQFRLKSENDAGSSPWSTEITFKTAPERPGRPGKPHAKGKIHGTYFRARWDPPTDTGGAEILRYFLEISSGPKFERIYTGSEPETTCDRLQPGTTYQLRASCEGPAGLSSYSEVALITSESAVPAAPPPPYCDTPPGPYAAVLRFEKPDYNGGAPVLEFELQQRQPNNNDTPPTIVYRGKEAYCVVKDLQPGCAYEVQSRALNRVGPGFWSTWFQFTAAAAPPVAPEEPKVVIKSATHLALSWQEPSNNGSPISEYRLESAAVPSSETDANVAPPSPPSTASFTSCYQGLQTSADLRNLLPYTLYYFRLNASNVSGTSKWSALAHAKTPAAVPSAPQIKDYEFTANEVSLRWNEPDTNGAPITAYNIEYADHSIKTDIVTEYTISELTPETAYKFRVQAINAVGVGPYSAYAKLTTLPSPPKPPSLECTGVGHNFIKLKWGEGRNVDFTKFYVEMYVQRAKEFQEVYSGTNCMCKVNKLQERTAYTFRIYAGTDRAGVGDYSQEYVFTTTSTLPSSIKPPRIAHEGGICILGGPAMGMPNSSTAYIPSAMLPETPTSYIAGLGNLSLGVPVTLEWQNSKNTFSDRVEYVLQYAIGKEGDFKKIYRGPETKFTIENMEPSTTYQFRVCPIRVTSNGEDLAGQFTPAFRYQVPHLPSLDDIDSNILNNAACMVNAAAAAAAAVSGGSCSSSPGGCGHGHSHHSHMHHFAHHGHNHSHHNSRHGGGGGSSNLHQRSVSASAAGGGNGGSSSSSSSSMGGPGGGGFIFGGPNAIGLIPLSSAIANDFAASFGGCDDPSHHHHHHLPFPTGEMDAASLLAATTSNLLSGANPLPHQFMPGMAGAVHHHQHGFLKRWLIKLTTMYTNRKRFTDGQKAGIFMVSFLIITFLFATLVRMFIR